MSSEEDYFEYLQKYLEIWCYDEIIGILEASGSYPSLSLDQRGNPRTLAQRQMIESQIKGIIERGMGNLINSIRANLARFDIVSSEIIASTPEYLNALNNIKGRIKDLL